MICPQIIWYVYEIMLRHDNKQGFAQSIVL